MMARFLKHGLKAVTPFFLGSATALVVVGVGFAVMQIAESEPEESKALGDSAKPTDKLNVASRTVDPPTSVTLRNYPNVTNIDDLIAIRSDIGRRAAMRRLLASGDEHHALDLLTRSKQLSLSSVRQIVQMETFKRLASISPRRALEETKSIPLLSRNQYISAIFSEWANLDLTGAIESIASLSRGEAAVAIKAIIQSSDDLSANAVEDIVTRTGFDFLKDAILTDLTVELATDEPQLAWNAILGDQLEDYGQIETLATIADAWIARDGWNALAQIEESIVDRRTRGEVLSAVFSKTVSVDPENTFQHAKAFYEKTNESPFRFMLLEWAKLDPAAAIQAALSIGRGNVRDQQIEFALLGWATKDPHHLLQSAPGLPEELQQMGLAEAIKGIARNSPVEAAGLVPSLDESQRIDAASRVGYFWVQEDPQQAMDWILNDASIQKGRRELLSNIAFALAIHAPELAMQVAVEQPLNEWGRSLESELIGRLVSANRIDAARAFLPRVRNDASKISAFVAVGYALISRNDVVGMIELGESLAESERIAYFQELLKQWSWDNPQRMFKSIAILPTEELKQRAAQMLLEESGELYEEQMNYLTSLLE